MSLFSKKKIREDVIGEITDLEGKSYELIRLFEKPNRKKQELYDKMGIKKEYRFLLFGIDGEYTPDDAINLHFDFNLSDKNVNLEYIENFLILPTLIKNTIINSKLTKPMIDLILSNKFYNTSFNKELILKYQNVFKDDFLKELKTDELWIVFTQNILLDENLLKKHIFHVDRLLKYLFLEKIKELSNTEMEKIKIEVNKILDRIGEYNKDLIVKDIVEEIKSEINTMKKSVKANKLIVSILKEKINTGIGITLDFDKQEIVSKEINKLKRKISEKESKILLKEEYLKKVNFILSYEK